MPENGRKRQKTACYVSVDISRIPEILLPTTAGNSVHTAHHLTSKIMSTAETVYDDDEAKGEGEGSIICADDPTLRAAFDSGLKAIEAKTNRLGSPDVALGSTECAELLCELGEHVTSLKRLLVSSSGDAQAVVLNSGRRRSLRRVTHVALQHSMELFVESALDVQNNQGRRNSSPASLRSLQRVHSLPAPPRSLSDSNSSPPARELANERKFGWFAVCRHSAWQTFLSLCNAPVAIIVVASSHFLVRLTLAMVSQPERMVVPVTVWVSRIIHELTVWVVRTPSQISRKWVKEYAIPHSVGMMAEL